MSETILTCHNPPQKVFKFRVATIKYSFGFNQDQDTGFIQDQVTVACYVDLENAYDCMERGAGV